MTGRAEATGGLKRDASMKGRTQAMSGIKGSAGIGISNPTAGNLEAKAWFVMRKGAIVIRAASSRLTVKVW